MRRNNTHNFKVSNMSLFPISVVLKNGLYKNYVVSSLSLNEITDRFEAWNRNGYTILDASITFDGKTYFRFRDYEVLFWIIENKDNFTFHYVTN